MRATASILLLLFIAAAAFAASEKKAKVSKPPSVTLDVKDQDVRDILKSMQQQCAIKNLIVDPQVQGKGTFYFRDLPCSTAFNVVFRTLDLRGVTYSKTLVAVSPRR